MLKKYTKRITKCSLTIRSTMFTLSCLLHVDFFHLKLSQNKIQLMNYTALTLPCFSKVFFYYAPINFLNIITNITEHYRTCLNNIKQFITLKNLIFFMSCILYIKEKEDSKTIASSCFISKYLFEVKCVCVCVSVCLCACLGCDFVETFP